MKKHGTLIFYVGIVFHAARIAGATARGERDFPAIGHSIDEAEKFVDAAEQAEVLPDEEDTTR